MALPNITLAQFNRIASGTYNAGLVDFMTDEQGNLTGELTKVNNHVWKTGKNTTVLSPERILEVKEAFINALKAGGVKPEVLAKIRNELGVPAELSASADVAAKCDMLEARFKPLTRADVRKILDDYAKNGRGFTHESSAAVTYDDTQNARRAAQLRGTGAVWRDNVNAAAVNAAKGRYRYEISDALGILSTNAPLSKACQALATRFKGANAVNDLNAAKTAMKNQFMNLFQNAMKLLDGQVNETDTFTFFGMKAKIVKGADGKLEATLGEGALETKVAIGKTSGHFINDIIARAVIDTDTIGADNINVMLDKVFSRDVEGFLTGEDRTSLTRSFATLILMKKTGTPEQREIQYNDIMKGAYNTGTLVEVANLALDGQVATKEDLDRLHAELVKNNAGLDDEMKEMLSRVAGMPIIRTYAYDGSVKSEMTVSRQIVADLHEVANQNPVQNLPPIDVVPRDELAATAANVKDFIADLVFSDETMVSDVVVNLPGESMRLFFADDKKIAALAKIIQAPEIIDTAVSDDLAPVVKEGFDKIKALLAEEWAKTHEGETLD